MDAMTSPTVVLLPVWAAGHFSSMLHAGKRLQKLNGAGSAAAFSLTVLVIPPPERFKDSSQGHDSDMVSGDGVGFHHLPAVEHSDDLPGGHPSEYIRLYAPRVKEAIAGLASPVAAVVVDFFATPLLDVAHDLAVPAYVYFASTATTLALMLRLPTIYEESLSARFREKRGFVDVPGMPPVPVASMPSPELNDYEWFVYFGRRFMKDARGIVVNTAAELEPGVIAAIADGTCTPGDRAPPVYPIGPVLSLNKKNDHYSSPHECVRWLDAGASVRCVPLLREHGTDEPAAGARARRRARAQRAQLPVGAARPAGRRTRRPATGRVPGEDQGEGTRVAELGPADGDPGPRRRGRLRDALRLELDPGEPVARRAHGAVASLRRATAQRVRARGVHGRRR
ncbi:unnamed protein product [Urochloa humidicola]